MFISDVIKCPRCKSIDTTEYDTNFVALNNDGTGSKVSYYLCQNCVNRFKLSMKFTYNIYEARKDFGGNEFEYIHNDASGG